MSIKSKKIFVTGGTGFIGSWLCEKLADNNEVVAYDIGRRDVTSYTNLAKHPNFHLVKGDVLDKDNLLKSMEKSDIVIHLAAIAGVSSYYNYPLKTMTVNMIGTYNVLEAARRQNLGRFVYLSTSEVYGPYAFRAQEDGMTSQGHAADSRWTYSVSKLVGDHLSFCYFKEYSLPIVSVRPFNVYGPRQIGEGAIQIFARKAIKNEDITILGDGTQMRAWCYIDDAIAGILLCLEEEAVGNIFNIGNPEATINVIGLAKKIIQLSNSKSKIVFKESERTDVELRVPSIQKAQNILGFKPKVGLEEGLTKTIEWYKEVRL